MTDFRNVKLKVLSPEHSAAFQEAVFESGGRWRVDGDKVRYTDAKYLFTSSPSKNYTPTLAWGDSLHTFSTHPSKQINFITPAYRMTKIRIRNPEHSKFVQKKLFENGCSWGGRITKTQHADKGFLTISGSGQIRFCSEEFFNGQKHLTEIFIEDDSMDELISLPSHMAICPQCGNKRCPKASSFEYKCTGNNDVEQPEPTLESIAPEQEEASSNTKQKNATISTLSVDIETNVTTRFSGTEASDGSTASYYELPSGATELQHLISHKDMNSQIGEIFRACYRYGQASHSDKLRDAKKIQFYINAEIERLEKLNAK